MVEGAHENQREKKEKKGHQGRETFVVGGKKTGWLHREKSKKGRKKGAGLLHKKKNQIVFEGKGKNNRSWQGGEKEDAGSARLKRGLWSRELGGHASVGNRMDQKGAPGMGKVFPRRDFNRRQRE